MDYNKYIQDQGLTKRGCHTRIVIAMRSVRAGLRANGISSADKKQHVLISEFAKIVFNEDTSGKNSTQIWLLEKYIAGKLIKAPKYNKNNNCPWKKAKQEHVTKNKQTNPTTWDKLLTKARKECYATFLETDYWKAVTLMVKKRDGDKCTNCGGTDRLQVHHKTYSNHFSEHLNISDMITLCRICHAKLHGKKPN
jgi:5-methylcytosine-specific restriction endonuclease McrA